MFCPGVAVEESILGEQSRRACQWCGSECYIILIPTDPGMLLEAGYYFGGAVSFLADALMR